jgi:hypothetical protein
MKDVLRTSLVPGSAGSCAVNGLSGSSLPVARLIAS